MYLYHYSSAKYKSLLTLNGQKKQVKESDGVGEDYANHISFFFEPPPLEILGELYKGKHKFWFNGNEIYEYKIQLESLTDFKYKVVEYPEKTEIYYDTSIDDEEFDKLLKEFEKKFNYTGDSVEELKKVLKRLKGTTKKYFELLPTRSNFEELIKKYAPTVPHLMIYPKSQEIHYESVRKIIIKPSKKISITKESFSLPIYTKW